MTQNLKIKLGLAVTGAIGGVSSAIRVDYKSFKTQNANRTVFDQRDFDWKYAIKRYLEAAVLGALSGLGLDLMSNSTAP